MARTIVTSFIVLALVVADRPEPICDGNLYGHPNANDCNPRLNMLENTIDRKHYLFVLPSVTRRPQNPLDYRLDVTTYQWRQNKVELPIVKRAQGGTSRCNFGIFPIELPDGSLSWDKGFYRYMAMESRHIVGQCIRTQPNGPGGRVLTGSNGRLAAILYEPGSEWDFQVQAAEAQNRPIYVPLNAAGNPPVAGLHSTSLVNPPGASTVTTATTTVKPNPTIKPEPGNTPKPGNKPDPGTKPGPGNFRDPWSAWIANFGAEGQGSSWE